MTRSSLYVAMYLPLALLALEANPASGQTQPPDLKRPTAKWRLATYDKPTGETYFALSLLPTTTPAAAKAVDTVVLFDTSASQNGLFRRDALRTLHAFLDNLTETDRVKIFALDLDAVALQDGFAPANSESAKQAIAKIERRTPLGSTDLLAGISAAVGCFEGESGNARTIVYFGDGLSRANIVSDSEIKSSLAKLVKARASIYSFIIGPRRELELLATFAHHTGGMLLIDTDEDQAAEIAGLRLAQMGKMGVLWRIGAILPEAFEESFPAVFPPLRGDRDSILIGVLKKRGPMTVSITTGSGNEKTNMNWRITPESSNDEFGFLPRLVDTARKTEGRMLPTLGSAGLKEAGRVIMNDARGLVKMGTQALKRNEARAALRAAEAVLARDPTNPDAKALKRAAEKKLRAQQAAVKKANSKSTKKEKEQKQKQKK